MARIARIVLPNYPHHLTQRGVRSLPVFHSAFSWWINLVKFTRRLVDYAKRHNVAHQFSSFKMSTLWKGENIMGQNKNINRPPQLSVNLATSKILISQTPSNLLLLLYISTSVYSPTNDQEPPLR